MNTSFFTRPPANCSCDSTMDKISCFIISKLTNFSVSYDLLVIKVSPIFASKTFSKKICASCRATKCFSDFILTWNNFKKCVVASKHIAIPDWAINNVCVDIVFCFCFFKLCKVLFMYSIFLWQYYSSETWEKRQNINYERENKMYKLCCCCRCFVLFIFYETKL